MLSVHIVKTILSVKSVFYFILRVYFFQNFVSVVLSACCVSCNFQNVLLLQIDEFFKELVKIRSFVNPKLFVSDVVPYFETGTLWFKSATDHFLISGMDQSLIYI